MLQHPFSKDLPSKPFHILPDTLEHEKARKDRSMRRTDSWFTKETTTMLRHWQSRPKTSADAVLADDPDISATKVVVSKYPEIPNTYGDIKVVILQLKTATSLNLRPAIYFIHGDPFMADGPLDGISGFFNLIKQLDLVLLTIDYRLLDKYWCPTPLTDCYRGLQYVFKEAKNLRIDPTKIMIAGQFLGGGLAAATAIMARDGVDMGLHGGGKLMAQCLICPIVDDRLVLEVDRNRQDEVEFWTSEVWKKTVWDYYLRDPNSIPDYDGDLQLIVDADPSDKRILSGALRKEKLWRTYHRSQHLKYVTPACAPNLYDLPPTWIDVGREEVFRGQVMEYATRLMDAGNETELHILKGDRSDFDSLHKPQTKISQAYVTLRLDWVRKAFKNSR
ncbi:putative alpha beta hydrolase fold protein [Botrytis fragariae]|uniref:Putative alpha beta hydrolase fold protein n=1 Tax=Botrytis fragariae TaxID=1964551 RepID=A0A8H6AQY4_9HELO|nr:putative alpha beta hydrolase fold protein [Botrytis fragariae]KAF5872186.1 putative alpha beta hydrolase fold protein [Botrytis fragariae]